MIKESLKIHGKKQFEIKQQVFFPRKSKEIRYQVETFFFLPASMQVNPDLYTPSNLQRSLKNYIRLRAPTVQLSSIPAVGGLVDELKSWLERLDPELPPTLDEYENHLKRFALTFKRSVRLTLKMVAQNSQRQTEEYITGVLADIEHGLKRYRELSAYAAPIEKVIKSNAFAYCDEFMSHYTLFYLQDLLKDKQLPLRDEIRHLWYQEMRYLKKLAPDSFPHDENDAEMVTYRRNLLKKYINRYLYLEIRHKRGLPLLLHSIYGIAAAISMVFATFIAFMWQGKYGALSANLFLAMVIGYIFKDRLKEIGREQLYRLFQRWIPDRQLRIYREGVKEPVGVCKESFRFLKESTLSPDIHEMRQKSHWVNLVNVQRVEDILYYRKDVTLHSNSAAFMQTQSSIVDITRVNISDFLKYLDISYEELMVNDDEPVIIGEKVYHIYLCRRVIMNKKAYNELARLVVNADGIKRLEILQPLDELDSDEDITIPPQ
ncbi:hypothetical protein M5X66_15805 [Providencia sp. PROV188]|uniref:hypothetical protein n=1 Tax=Providencia TaxID=586 RepID=UPI0003E20E08|nr:MULTISPECIES: hypothetical protein [Providencia]ETT02666.1 hypothetical protein HMPREF1568_1915 [Providencia alcalifaciens PAL-3]EUC98835.1 hypothetical protein HMPREF1566_1337 [Providencia alcalifaciens PAL-1]MTC23581.1 hypothetical protein [Providencia sp. wls1938]MTC42367.1 hypothetical protein [Providencia sp. wls1921]MTC79144.1 hypothetical protein [Providencia sp. wls1916]